ncbi:MAG TPA: metallophosphoesterase [Terracidiphilus sp.]|nr:metallophosphoesterase [Terracidiphilus sp.]
MKSWPVLGIFLIQVILLLAYWFLYHTWIAFFDPASAATVVALHVALLVLAFSFTVTTLLSFRFSNPLLSLFYWCAAVWLGFLNYFFWAACFTWLVWYASLALHLFANPAAARPLIAGSLAAIAFLTGIYSLLNARWIRVRRIPIALPGLPASWRGRRAVLLSDLHLGSINGAAFSRRMVALASSLEPHIVFIPGDLFDGTKADLDKLAAPFKNLAPPFGVYFSTGNHEEFSDPAHFLQAATRAGMIVLHNEKTIVDNLVIVGVPYGDSTSPIRLRATLEALSLATDQASILLNHMPSRLPIVEGAGVSLQLSGHTHGGQFFPFTWPTRRIFGRFTHGLHQFGALQVYTSTGAGTWGPPMRLGTHPEIVLLTFA